MSIIHHNVALATYFYVVSEDSTSFLSAAACAEYQKELPAGEFPLICTLSSTPGAEKSIIEGESCSVIGCCKKFTRVRCPGGVQALYKQLFPPKHHPEPCFGEANKVAPLLRFASSTAFTTRKKYGCKR